MNNPEFTKLRRFLDDAITYGDMESAIRLSREGLWLARDKEAVGEMMYFSAQREIIGENYPQAIKLLDQAVQYNPKDGAAYNDRALCMIELGQTEKVMDYFDRGIAVEPDYATIYHNKGWFLNKLGRPEEAIQCFEIALSLEPNRPVTFENLADLYANQGKLNQALNAYKKAAGLINDCYPEIKTQIDAQIQILEKRRQDDSSKDESAGI